jgi:hypothetical protein
VIFVELWPSAGPAARASVEEKRRKKASRLLEATPEMSVKALAKALNCRWGKADQLKREWMRSRQSGLVAL